MRTELLCCACHLHFRVCFTLGVSSTSWQHLFADTAGCHSCVSLRHCSCGGRIIQPAYVDSVAKLCKDAGLRLHLDGARIMNASVALNISPDELVKHFDSVSVCLSKGLGAPVGSVLVGSDEFIYKVTRCPHRC